MYALPRIETELRLANDDDLIRLFPAVDKHWPRRDRIGNIIHDWAIEHAKAVSRIVRKFKSLKDVAEVFEIGKLGARTRADLRDCAAYYALHFIYFQADSGSDDNGFFARKAREFEIMADNEFKSVTIAVDYDDDGSDVIDTDEQERPFPPRMIRG